MIHAQKTKARYRCEHHARGTGHLTHHTRLRLQNQACLLLPLLPVIIFKCFFITLKNIRRMMHNEPSHLPPSLPCSAPAPAPAKTAFFIL